MTPTGITPPDCDLGNFAANGECGQISDQNFGKNDPRATRWSNEVLRGWGVRDSNWDFATEVQHELRAGGSMTAGYYRNTGGYYRNTNSKERVTDNQALAPSDFDPYCITAPAGPRLPGGGGGYQVCGLYDINPNKFSQVSNLVTQASNYGKQKRVNLPRNVRLQANVDAYNVLNNSSVLSVISTFGPRWRQPNSILDARMIQFGGQVTF